MVDPSPSGRGGPGPRVTAYVRWTLRHGRLIWMAALLLAVPALVRTVMLYAHLKSDIEELLPRKAPSVAAIDELRARMPGLRYLGIIVDTGTAENVPAAERFLDDLATRIATYPPTLVKRTKTSVAEERRFFERHAPLYADLEDLKLVRDRIEQERDTAVSRALDLDLGDTADQAPIDLSDLESKYRAREKEASRFPNDRFSSPLRSCSSSSRTFWSRSARSRNSAAYSKFSRSAAALRASIGMAGRRQGKDAA